MMQSEHSQYMLINSGGILSSDCGQMKSGYDIIIEGETIAKIAGRTGKQPNVAPSCNVIDLKGMYLLPGIINNHTHLLLPMGNDPLNFLLLLLWPMQIRKTLKDRLRQGETFSFDKGCYPRDGRKYMQKVKENVIPGPDFITTFNMLSLPGGYPTQSPDLDPLRQLYAGGNFATRIHNREHMIRAIKSIADTGSTTIKIAFQSHAMDGTGAKLPTFSDEDICFLFTAIPQNMRISAHVLYLDDYRRLISLCKRHFFERMNIEHLPIDGKPDNDLLKASVDLGVIYTPTLSVYYDQIEENVRKSLIRLDGFKKEKNFSTLTVGAVNELHKRLNCSPEQLTKKEILKKYIHRKPFADGIPYILDTIHWLKTMGATICFGNDSGGTDSGWGNTIQREFDYMLASRLFRADESLYLMTKRNAEVNQLNRGVLQEGFLADIIAVKSNPLETNRLEYPDFVMKRGRVQAL